MNVKENLAELCKVEAALSALTRQRDKLRRQLLSVALDEMENHGAAPTWRTPQGTVGLTIPKPKPTIVDATTLETFITRRYGNEALETVTRIKPEAFDALIAECSYADTVCALVTPDGEPVPGVTVAARLPFLFVKLTTEAKLAAQLAVETHGHDLNYEEAG